MTYEGNRKWRGEVGVLLAEVTLVYAAITFHMKRKKKKKRKRD